MSLEIRILAEVEKVWIIFDIDSNGRLDKDEVKDYIKFMSEQVLELNDMQIDELYSLIDTDNDGSIDKEEMIIFLRAIMFLQKGLTFKQSSDYMDRLEARREAKKKIAKERHRSKKRKRE